MSPHLGIGMFLGRQHPNLAQLTLERLQSLLAPHPVSTLYLASAAQVVNEAFFDNVVGCSAVGTTLTKTAAGGSWNAGAASSQVIPLGGGVKWVPLNGGARVAGLSAMDAGTDYATVGWGIATHVWTADAIDIVELGVRKTGASIPYSVGDELEIRVSLAGVVTYYKNGILIYTSLTNATGYLHFDAAFYLNGASLSVTLTGATPPSGRVSLIYGQTQPGYDLSQATASKQPLLVKAPVPYWEFDGARVMIGAPVPLAVSYSVFAIARYTGPDPVAAQRYIFSDGNQISTGCNCCIHNSQNLLLMSNKYAGPTAKYANKTPVAGINTRRHIDCQWDGTEIKIRENSGAWGAAVASSMDLATGQLALGGADITPSGGFLGEYYALGLVSTVFSTAEYSRKSSIILPQFGVA